MNYYDSIADGYDELHGEEQLEKYRVLASLECIEQADTILDLGHGSGLITQVFSNRIVGIDTSKELLARSSAHTIIHDLNEPLPFEDASFDWVVSFTVIHHARDPEEVIREARRIARSGVAMSVLRALESYERLSAHFTGWKVVRAGADTLFLWSRGAKPI